MSLNIIQMTDNLRTAFYRKEINIPEDQYEQSFEEWLDSLSTSQLLFRLEYHGGDTTLAEKSLEHLRNEAPFHGWLRNLR